VDAAEDRLVLVPVGSTEQHGPHLPFDVDTRVAVAVAQAAASRLGTRPAPEVPGPTGVPGPAEVPVPEAAPVLDEGVARGGSVVVAPAVAYGASGEHQDFPGTLSIGTDVLTWLLVELGRSATTWARRVLLVNGHGGNVEALTAAVTRLRSEGRDVAWVPALALRTADVAAAPTGQGAPFDAHAGRTETSLLLHLDPAAVDLSAARPGSGEPLARLLPALRAGGVRAVSANGVLGDPTGADAAQGRALLDAAVAGVVRRIEVWRPDEAGRLTQLGAAEAAEDRRAAEARA